MSIELENVIFSRNNALICVIYIYIHNSLRISTVTLTTKQSLYEIYMQRFKKEKIKNKLENCNFSD